MDFCKKWLRKHQKFLLHFLIHIDVFMLCSKFELILTSIFRVTVIFKNEPKSEKITAMDFMTSLLTIKMAAVRVELTCDTYLCCLTHAMSTEREEVMGLLLGEVRAVPSIIISTVYPYVLQITEEGDAAVVQVFSLYMMRRLDKQPDRVEISPEQLSSGAIEAESLSERMGRTVQVVGWYHSHPHITVWPSHVGMVGGGGANRGNG